MGTYAQEDELYDVRQYQNAPDSVWLDYIQSGVFCHILRFFVGCRSPPSPFQFTIHPLTPELKWRTSMFDKKSEYALNKHDQDSIIYICPIPLCGELRHLLVDEPLLLLRHPELHLDISFSICHAISPPFLIRVWDYPSKQFLCLGAGVPLNRKSASGYSLAVLAIVTLPSYSPSTNTTILNKRNGLGRIK